eukprot:GHVP01043873.1.p1 GENE.GHVP01043873.1~~GHVP01043873.1.p1  ORF type:complete len:260 (+),score=52.84 GHVP01043873.1:374-1153(+)
MELIMYLVYAVYVPQLKERYYASIMTRAFGPYLQTEFQLNYDQEFAVVVTMLMFYGYKLAYWWYSADMSRIYFRVVKAGGDGWSYERAEVLEKKKQKALAQQAGNEAQALGQQQVAAPGMEAMLAAMLAGGGPPGQGGPDQQQALMAALMGHGGNMAGGGEQAAQQIMQQMMLTQQSAQRPSVEEQSYRHPDGRTLTPTENQALANLLVVLGQGQSLENVRRGSGRVSPELVELFLSLGEEEQKQYIESVKATFNPHAN